MKYLTKSQYQEFIDAGEFPADTAIENTLIALYEALAETNSALQAVLSSNPVRNADEIIARNNVFLS
jgi:hypothetical protein